MAHIYTVATTILVDIESDRELTLDCELRKAHKEVDRAQQSDLYHHRDLQNKGLTD